MTEARLYWLHALTPLHVGAGRGVGYIDLPIVREKVTNWPLVPGSAVKGVLADMHNVEGTRKKKRETLTADERLALSAFGKGGDEHSNSGSLVFTDARIVCLPVRSFYGTFAWCTSPMVLHRLKRDLGATMTSGFPEGVPRPSAPGGVLLPGADSAIEEDGKVFFEDLDFEATDQNGVVKEWATCLGARIFAGEQAWQDQFLKRFAIVPDAVFDFLCETATEVNARVKIRDESKTVESRALWYEEALPSETILGGVVWCDRIFGDDGYTPHALLDRFCTGADLQIGGKATVGHGRVRCLFSSGGPRP